MAGLATEKAGAPLSSSLIGREGEVASLRAALDRVKAGRGETWTVLGQGGMGKTRLLRWLEEDARSRGFQVRSGTCLKESLAPFFPFEQVFRVEVAAPEIGSQGSGASLWPEGLPTLGLVEEPRPKAFWTLVESSIPTCKVLVATRERPATLRASRPALQKASGILWVTRVEGPDHLSPGDLDTLAHRAEAHFRSAPGSLVAIEGLEYLVSQGEFAPVLRLVQFLRDVAQDSDGHLLLTLNPTSFGMREVSLLESDAEVQRVERPSAGEPPRPSRPPAERLLLYLASLETAGRRTPQLIVLDDLQWADPASASAFQFLAKNLADLPVLLVGALREESEPGPDGGRPPIEETREVLQRAGLVHSLPLHGLGEKEALSLAAMLLGARAVEFSSPVAGAALVRRTAGNPYFLREIFLQLLEEGRVRRDGERSVLLVPGAEDTTSPLALPDTVRRLVARRLSSLPPAARSFLEACAVEGSEFDPAPLATVLQLDESTVRERLELLHRERRLIEPVGKLWGCAHPLVWEVTLGEMDPAARRQMARRLGDWWASHRPDETDTLARLWHDTGDAVAARPWLVRAVNEAVRRFAAEPAAVYLRWMREMRRGAGGASDWGLLRTELDLAREVSALGRAGTAKELILALLDEQPPPAVRIEILIVLAWTLLDLDSRQTEVRVAEAFELARREGLEVPPLLRARGLIALGFVRSHRREFAPSVVHLRDALTIIPADGPTRIRAEAYLELAFDETQLDHLDEARKALEEGYALARATQNPVAMSIALNARGALFAREGDLARAYSDFLEAAGCSRQRGHVTGYCIALQNASEMLAYLGDEERAERLARESLDVARKFSLERAEVGALNSLARIASFQARWAEALRFSHDSLRALELARREGTSLVTHLVVAQARSNDPSDLEGGRQALREWLAHAPPEVEEQIDAHRALADVEARLGKLGEAREELKRARSLLPQRPNNRFLELLVARTDLLLTEKEGRASEAGALRAQVAELERAMRAAWPPDST